MVPILKFPLAKVLCLRVTESCNLNCTYCFDEKKSALKMSFKTAKKAIDSFLKPTVEKGETVGLSFFGGEPLLNFDLIKAVVKYCEGWLISYSVTTNATLVTDEMAAFFVANNFEILASIDGPEDIHDLYRVDNQAKGSYSKTREGIEKLGRAGITKMLLRATFGSECMDLLRRTVFLNMLCDKGFGNNVSIEPFTYQETAGYTTGCKVKEIRPFVDSDFDVIEEEYNKVSEYIIHRIRNDKTARFHNIMSFVDRLQNKHHYFRECGAGDKAFTVTGDGKVYACHRKGDTEIGSLKEGIDKDKRSFWLGTCITDKCLDCDLFMICGGPCRFQSKNTNIPDPIFCKFRRIWIQNAIKIVNEIVRSKDCGKS